MRKLFVVGLFFYFLFFGNESFATVGCLVGSSLYTSINGTDPGKTYFDSSPSIGASGFCLRDGTSTSSCQIRTWFIIFWSYGNNGIMGDFGPSNPPLYCPIDNEVWLLLFVAGGLGIYFLRKNSLSVLNF